MNIPHPYGFKISCLLKYAAVPLLPTWTWCPFGIDWKFLTASRPRNVSTFSQIAVLSRIPTLYPLKHRQWKGNVKFPYTPCRNSCNQPFGITIYQTYIQQTYNLVYHVNWILVRLSLRGWDGNRDKRKKNYYPSPSFEHAHTWFTIDRQTGQTETENEKSSYGRITSTTATQYTFPHTNTHP